MPHVCTRRKFVTRTVASLTAAALLGPHMLAPRLARASDKPYLVLTPLEVATLEALGDTLLPGAAEAGIAHYIDQQLANSGGLLLLQYLDFPQRPSEFYQAGLASLEQIAISSGNSSFHRLSTKQREAFVSKMASGNLAEWTASPPAALFYFTLRADAIDVYYGTQEGFTRLGVPYLAHIPPTTPW